MYRVAEAFANLLADVLPNTDDVAGRSHLHNLSVVRHAVESSVHQQTAFAEERLDVKRYLHVCGIHAFILQDYCIEFQYATIFYVHGCKSTKKNRNPCFRLNCGCADTILLESKVLF